MTTQTIPLVVRRTIAAPRSQIFDAFASAKSLSQWFTPSAEISLQPEEFTFEVGAGFRLRYIMPDGTRPVVTGVYEQIEPPARIVFSWVWEAPDPLADIPMRVVFEFFEKGAATQVVVTHEKLPSDQSCTIHQDGWEGSLNSLERYIGASDHETKL